ncbi:DNA internalization-related competence protein ComEC/Rec2 [Bacillus cytotoxicus]|uniref:DNA internalization-related competence protein ComEC/Rec2 n=1 Tax=Bacillus cereus group sp. BfR-BA-01492 TaxID=2920361 RepID=UPI001F5947CB|nr:DNA internalization-related competence protein ComEC/Rec2 [Bacillus cereus group sp. BfR-BA-01492]EMA6341659.1 DNA internalization-related competence protein ComEC/Rec2 [Bacillus cytotoxicus]
MRRQWGYIAISFVIGIAIACSSSQVLVTILFGCYFLFCIYRTSRQTFMFCIVACLSSFLYTSYIEQENKPSMRYDLEFITGVIQNTPLMNGDRLSFQIEDNSKNKVQLFYKMQSEKEKNMLRGLRVGMECTFRGALKEPPSARNFHGFDYKHYLHKQRIHFLFEATEIMDCNNNHVTFVNWLFQLRQEATLAVAEMFPEQSGAFMNALLFGDRQFMSYEVEQQYQQFGLIHLLAISGSHIVLLSAIVYFILLRIGVTRERTTTVLIICIPLYMFFAGASPSVMRASIMGTLLLIGVMHSFRLFSIDAISVTAIFMLIYDPYMLFDIGFQFSFIGSLALLLSANTLLQYNRGVIQNAVILSLISQLVSIPITLYHFGYFSPYSIPLNLIYVPFLSCIVLPCSIIIFLCMMLFPPMAKGIAHILSICLRISNDILQYCEAFPFVRLTFGQTPPFLVALYSFSIIIICIVWERAIRKAFLYFAFGSFFFLCMCHYLSPYFRASGSVTFIDVGQGDAILIRLPYEKGVYLIDTGGTIPIKKEHWQQKKHEFSIGDDVLLPFLQKQGIRTIDKLIVTHGDADHMGAAKEVVSALDVKEVIFGKKRKDSVLEAELKHLAQKKDIRINEVKEGDGWKVDEAEFRILSPEGTETSDNDSSIVLWTKIGEFTWLFTGDLEGKGEERIVKQYPNLRADILKVGHHGSKTSSTAPFLHLIQPKKAIISVGEHNRYGHPHDQVLKRLEERQVEVWRTDREGAILYTFQGKNGTFQSKLTYDEAQKRMKKDRK